MYKNFLDNCYDINPKLIKMVSSLNRSVGARKHPLFLLAISFICAFVSGSVIKIENGVYKGITVRVRDDVSSCHCDQVIENLQVRLKH